MSAPPAGGLLLDTHVFVWWATDDDRISDAARAALANPDTPVFLSAVTPWEITIKHALGRLELTEAPRPLIYGQIARHGYHRLDVTLEHVLAVAELPSHHGDPFDRLLIAQARTEGLTLVTADAAFAAYGIALLW